MSTPDDARRILALRAYGLALSCVVAAIYAALLNGWSENHWIFWIAASAMGLAVARTRASRWARGEAAVDVVLFGLVLAALPIGRGPWLALFAAAGAVAGLFGLAVARFGRRAAIAGTLVLALGGGAVGVRVLGEQAPWSERHLPLHTWNQFHYVLGTKYIDELGYFDLYTAVLLADADGQGHFRKVIKVRDLRTYEFTTRKEAFAKAREEGLRERFTDERWALFQEDIETFWPYKSEPSWRGVFTDLGFNPSPAWSLLHKPLLNTVDLHGGRTLEFFSALQVLWHAAAVAALWWAFGLRTTLWMVLWMLLFFGNRGRLLGGYFSYDWNTLALVGVALFAKGRTGLAAPLVAYGGLMRGYVGLVSIGPAVEFVDRGVRRLLGRTGGTPWRETWRPSNLRFLGVLAVSMALIFTATVLTGRGIQGWVDWHDKIALHGYRISCGTNHLGMKTLFGEDYFQPGLTEGMDVRREVLASQLGAYRITAAALLAWTLWVIRRRSPLDGYVLGLVPVFVGMVLSRYYYSVFSMYLLLGTTPEDREPRLPALLGMFAMTTAFHGTKAFGSTTLQGWYQVANFSLLALCGGALASFTAIDLRRRPAKEAG